MENYINYISVSNQWRRIF